MKTKYTANGTAPSTKSPETELFFTVKNHDGIITTIFSTNSVKEAFEQHRELRADLTVVKRI